MGLINSLKTKTSYTANGALTNDSSLNHCLDLFFLAGASRNMSESDITALYSKAFAEDKETALKILFWARDVREGAGERRIFRIILKWLANKDIKIFNRVLLYVDDFGRWDDLFFDESILKYTLKYVAETIKANSLVELGLLFKWLPREKSKNKKIAKRIMKELSLSSKAYRKLLSENSTSVEQLISENKWGQVDYKGVPSKAFNLYRNAFKRHDESRFDSFLNAVEKGETSVNAGSIFPLDIYKSSRGGDRKSIVAQWNALPDYLNDEDIMPVCDTSASMTGEPMDVAISLGVYLSERSKGKFKDSFITFEGKPKLQNLKGDCVDRFNQISRTRSDCSTNLQGVFDLILGVAKRDSLSQSDLPTKLLIISDMEFNSADGWGYSRRDKTNFEAIREKFNEAGYKMPGLIFWNVNGRMGNVPVQATDRDTALIGGYSPSIVKSVLGGDDLSPMGVMYKTINAERYAFIKEAVV